MSNPAPSIPYASTAHVDTPADRLLRRIVAGTAILYGGEALVGRALHIALGKGWLSYPSTMFWSVEGGWLLVSNSASSVIMCALLVAGVLLLRRSPPSIPLLRAAVAAEIVVHFVGLALVMRSEPVFASYWSAPGTFAVYSLQELRSLLVPVLLVLLTLPPLARRML
jgi:hypothetical protein